MGLTYIHVTYVLWLFFPQGQWLTSCFSGDFVWQISLRKNSLLYAIHLFSISVLFFRSKCGIQQNNRVLFFLTKVLTEITFSAQIFQDRDNCNWRWEWKQSTNIPVGWTFWNGHPWAAIDVLLGQACLFLVVFFCGVWEQYLLSADMHRLRIYGEKNSYCTNQSFLYRQGFLCLQLNRR